MRVGTLLRRAGVLTGASALAALALTTATAPAATAAPSPQRAPAATPAPHAVPAALTGWTQVAHSTKFTLTSNEGIATVNPPGGTPYQDIVGTLSVPPALSASNWGHIGDPDSSRGYIFDNFQYSGSNPTSKLFRVTTPGGTHYDYTHPLTAGEEMNNSWDAVSPDGQWMVDGEWDTMTRFLVFPTPILNPAAPATGGTLNLAFQLNLDHPVRDVQGCTFESATRLLCSADDPDTDLFPTAKQLLQIDLPAALAGTTVTGHVTSLGQLPLNSSCSGNFEVEGDDYDPATGDLRVLIVQPGVCAVVTDLYTFHQG
jgi:hypothetical protein